MRAQARLTAVLVALAGAQSAAAPLDLPFFGPAVLDKPTINPAFDMDGSMETQLRNTLKYPSQIVVGDWDKGVIPQTCYEESVRNNINPKDLEAHDVWYPDCPDPWTVCRHKNSNADFADSLWVRPPLRSREFTALRRIV
jgi:hypothetical protein